MPKPLFKAMGLTKEFEARHQIAGIPPIHRAVDQVSFSIYDKDIVGIVGESGSGKTTLAQLCCRLIEPTSGHIEFLDTDFLSLSGKELQAIRLQMQMVFQDPAASLNPRKTVLENLGEPLLYHQRVPSKAALIPYVSQILYEVGLPGPILHRYPHEFSGGQQQRLSIGRALSLRPKLLLLDEAVSALDVSVQAQILNLLYDLRESAGLSYLFISHDLRVIRSLCNRVLVMYQGKMIESRDTESLFLYPQNSYTKKLISCIL